LAERSLKILTVNRLPIFVICLTGVMVPVTLEKEVGTSMDYPEEWNQLLKHERKKKIKELMREQERKTNSVKKIRNWGIVVIVLFIVVFGYIQLTKKTPEQTIFEQQIKAVSLDGKVEEFSIEGRDHVLAGTRVEYKTNPPTSGSHFAQPQNWGVYSKEIPDGSVVHSLEHGGIWISYKEDISNDQKTILEETGRANSQSVIVSPRPGNDEKVVVVSWGRMMKLETADKALIQKYIDTYKNQSPERLAR